MRRLFYLFLKKHDLKIEGVPTRKGLSELSINFEKWANTPPRVNRQGCRAKQIKKHLAGMVDRDKEVIDIMKEVIRNL